MSDPAIAGYGVVDGPPLPLSANNTVLANLSGATAYPVPVTLAALSAALSTVAYQGTWDASTNTPTLVSSVGTSGQYYIVSVAGTTSLNGISDWSVGDWAIFNGTTLTWQKIEAGVTALTVGSTLVGGGTANGLLWRNAGVLAAGAATLVGGTALAGLATLAVAGALATGTVLTALGGVNIGASASAAAWTTSGVGLVQNAASYTDTSSTGTVATAYTNLIGASTVLASSATTFTSYYGTYFKAPVASTNVTFTNKSALGADTVSIGGAAQGTDALAVTGTTTISGNVQIGTNFRFVGATAASPMFKRSGADIQLRLGDDSAYGNLYLASVVSSGTFYTTEIDNIGGGSNAAIVTASTGTSITRNIADANTALIVNQINASSTGKIFEAKFASTTLFSVGVTGSLIMGNAAIATNATDGFFYAISGAGAPTGTPTPITGRVPVYVDTTNSQLWLHMGGAWKQPKTPAAAATITWQ